MDDFLGAILKVILITFAVAVVLNYMAFMSQEIERIRINTDKIVEKVEEEK